MKTVLHENRRTVWGPLVRLGEKLPGHNFLCVIGVLAGQVWKFQPCSTSNLLLGVWSCWLFFLVCSLLPFIDQVVTRL